MTKVKKVLKPKNSFRFLIKTSLCLIYLVVASILAYCAFHLYMEQIKPIKWEEAQDTKDYTYIDVDKMSEKFATIDKEKNIHFMIDEDKKTGLWHIYLLAINEKDYSKYKKIIDYSYGRRKKQPKSVRVYGYPMVISKDLKELTIKNYKNFVSFENQVELNLDNFNEYLTNAYLDSTKKEEHQFNWIVVILMILELVLIVLIVVTILDKDRIVDEVDRIVELEDKKRKRKKKSKAKPKAKEKQKKDENDEII